MYVSLLFQRSDKARPQADPADSQGEMMDDHPPKREAPDALMLSQRLHAIQRRGRSNRLGRFAWKVWAALALLALLSGLLYWLLQRGPLAETPIFQGVTYTCRQLPQGDESGGLLHLVRVDLTAPGVDLYTTPMEPTAAEERQYELQFTRRFLAANDLAAAVNATQFASDSRSLTWRGQEWPIRLPGDSANSVETVVSNHAANHVHRNSYLLWFDDELTPRLESSKGPSPEVLARARWGVGAQSILIRAGEPQRETKTEADARTAIGVDSEAKLLWLAVFEKASPRIAGEMLAELGVKDAILLDGGSSSAMALGAQAQGVRPGVVAGDWIPVATHFGVRASPLDG